ncbi:MAG TPA: SPOR domain-containing protein [Candidatus Krumholzibacteria bacterium]
MQLVTRITTRVTRIVLAAAIAVAALVPRGSFAAGDYGATFLKIPVGARLMASPDIVAGMRPDASLVYSNPAFVAGVENAGVYASSSRWLDQLSFNSVGAAIPLGQGGTVLGVGASLLYSGGLNGFDAAMNVVDEQGFYDLGLDVVIARRFGTTGLSAAAGATYLREHIVSEDGSGVAFHVGAAYWLGPTLLQASIRDVGGSVRFPSGAWNIAPEWSAGAGRVFHSGAGTFLAGLQASSSDAYGTRVRLGVDYALNDAVTLRTGINDNLDDAQPESRFNAGLGLAYGAMSVEYAYTPQDYFSGAHTFSLGYSFGGGGVRGTGTIVTPPVGDLAPPVPERSVASPQAGATRRAYALVAGAHATAASANEEAAMLGRLKIPAAVEPEGPRFRVVVATFVSFDEAARARSAYRARGHDFQILAR